ncbi:MAG: helix-turn-helix domain-containing protein [Alistipes sp.]|jgi:excisionase family DNA binding protein|nr:helix-turn-helix domain-containing protein [Alistipes sp.]MBR2339918.1 helix-turn-helix domain-containing protein [Clostridia bacterium]MBR2398716.1 helix-turn-helix domain-containing protein [Alistipes sp.]
MKEVSQTTPDVLYTVKEVAELLKTNIDYVHKLRKAGLLPFLKIGQYKVRKQSLELFLERYEGKDLTDPFDVKELN